LCFIDVKRKTTEKWKKEQQFFLLWTGTGMKRELRWIAIAFFLPRKLLGKAQIALSIAPFKRIQVQARRPGGRTSRPNSQGFTRPRALYATNFLYGERTGCAHDPVVRGQAMVAESFAMADAWGELLGAWVPADHRISLCPNSAGIV